MLEGRRNGRIPLRRLCTLVLLGCMLPACSTADVSPQAKGSTATPAPTESRDTDDSGRGQTASPTPPGRTYTEREQELMALLRAMRVANPGVAEHGFADIAHVGGMWRGRYVVLHTSGRAKWQMRGRTVDRTAIGGVPAEIVRVKSAGTRVHLQCAGDYLAMASHPDEDTFGSSRSSAVAFARRVVRQMRCT